MGLRAYLRGDSITIPPIEGENRTLTRENVPGIMLPVRAPP